MWSLEIPDLGPDVLDRSPFCVVGLNLNDELRTRMTEETIAILSRPKRHRFVTWRTLISDVLRRFGGRATLTAIFREVGGHPKTETVRNWRSAVRQTLSVRKDFRRVAPGEWELVR